MRSFLASVCVVVGGGVLWWSYWGPPTGIGSQVASVHVADLDRWAEAAVNGTSEPALDIRCKHAFFDLGANHGMAIRDFMDRNATDYRKKPFAIFLREHPDWQTMEFCIFGVEGHPAFAGELQKLEAEQREAGVLIKILTNTIVAADSTPKTLRLDDENRHVATSVVRSWDLGRHPRQVKVKAFALGEFIKHHVDPSGVCIVKMDIEGSEYMVLKELERSGALCDRDEKTGAGFIDYLNIEFHAGRPETHRNRDLDLKEVDPDWNGSPAELEIHYMERFRECGVQFGTSTD